MRSIGPMLRAAAPNWMLICILSGCTMTTGSSAIDVPSAPADVSSVACAAFQPIAWSTHDTDPTIRQIKAHNASFTALCSPRVQK